MFDSWEFLSGSQFREGANRQHAEPRDPPGSLLKYEFLVAKIQILAPLAKVRSVFCRGVGRRPTVY